MRTLLLVVLSAISTGIWACERSPTELETVDSSPPPPVAEIVNVPGKIAFSRQDQDGYPHIWVMADDGTGQTMVGADPSGLMNDWDPAWSPDGSQLAFVRYESVPGDPEGPFIDIWKMNSDGSGQIRVSSGVSDPDDPSWSPDGNRLAFNTGGGDEDIWVINTDGTVATNLTQSQAMYVSPDWSPDGSMIVFAGLSPDDGIFLMNADGSNPTRLFSHDDPDLPAGDPSWSPDGSQIVFWTYWGDDKEVVVMNADGSGVANLTQTPDSDEIDPVWSPDGSRIAFVSNRDNNYEIYVMSADGSGQTNLTNNPAPDREPSWQAGTTVGIKYKIPVEVISFNDMNDNYEVDTGEEYKKSPIVIGVLTEGDYALVEECETDCQLKLEPGEYFVCQDQEPRTKPGFSILVDGSPSSRVYPCDWYGGEGGSHLGIEILIEGTDAERQVAFRYVGSSSEQISALLNDAWVQEVTKQLDRKLAISVTRAFVEAINKIEGGRAERARDKLLGAREKLVGGDPQYAVEITFLVLVVDYCLDLVKDL